MMDKELHEAVAAYIAPLSDEEVAEIEADYQANPPQISPERDARQRAHLERLRQVYLAGYQAGRLSVSGLPELTGADRERLVAIGMEVFEEVQRRLNNRR